MKSKVNDFASHSGDDEEEIGELKSFMKKTHNSNKTKKKIFISNKAELTESTALLSGCEIVLKRVVSENISYNRRNKDAFITEWSVPAQLTFNQLLNYDFVVDWS